MDQSKFPQKKTGRVNYIWVLAGGYLWYLAAKLLGRLRTTDSLVLNLAGAAVFLAAGGWLFWREWSAYQYGLAHKDDPATWSDEAKGQQDEEPHAGPDTKEET